MLANQLIPPVFQMPSGLYGITPDWDDTQRLLDGIQAAIVGGMQVLQLRRKTKNLTQIQEQAGRIQELIAPHNIAFFINDHVDIAVELSVGVHLGILDANAREVRTQYPNLPIGLSCYNDITNVMTAQQINACYIAFGAVFPSTTKPQAIHAPLSLFAEAKSILGPDSPMKMVAIGGISPENAYQVRQAGADLIAVISQLFEQEDVTMNAKNLLHNFTSSTQIS